MPHPPEHAHEPQRDCALCPRLVAFRAHWQQRHPHWYNAPVPSFGGLDARFLIVGLAPGLQGANATGRPFTGDYAGDLLYQTLLDYGFASGVYQERADDGLKLHDIMISNALRCVPPENKPNSQEVAHCRPFLQAKIAAMPKLEGIIALGKIAHDNVLRALHLPLARHPFLHGSEYKINGFNKDLRLISSYHCSRYNTNTKRLTPAMFAAIFARVRVWSQE